MANENKTAKEYVQKGYLIAHLANCGIRTINYDEWERLCECIHEAKPADVVEVVHGEWIANKDSSFSCSVCKFNFYPLRFEYCPHCGTKMDADVIRHLEFLDKLKSCSTDMRGGTDNGNSI